MPTTPRYVSIPHGVATALQALTGSEQRAAVLLWQLKSVRVGGCIFNFRRRQAALATQLGYNDRTFRGLIGVLKARRWVWYEGPTLRVRSVNRIAEELGANVHAHHRVAVSLLPKLADVFLALAILEGTRQQEYTLSEVITSELLRELGISNPGDLSPKRLQSVRRLVNPKVWDRRLAHTTRYFQQQSRPDASACVPVHPRITYSRAGLAKLLGYASKSCATRVVRRLVTQGLLVDSPCEVTVMAQATPQEWHTLRQANFDDNYNLRYRRKPGHGTGRIVRVLANQLSIPFDPTDIIA